jgi:hypothetical protein
MILGYILAVPHGPIGIAMPMGIWHLSRAVVIRDGHTGSSRASWPRLARPTRYIQLGDNPTSRARKSDATSRVVREPGISRKLGRSLPAAQFGSASETVCAKSFQERDRCTNERFRKLLG